jgi:prepilin-type processing-associated H-X9-DG protein
MGPAHPLNVTQCGWGDGRHFNCTSVRYSINQNGFTGATADGYGNDTGGNFSINSAHPGGAEICMADGSVQFATDSMPLDLIHDHCTRAGGEIVFGGP